MRCTQKDVLFLLLAFLQSWNQFLLAQPKYDLYPVEYLNTTHGLLNNHINYILQDSQGFIWIGTNEGLNKFDGIRFIEYSHDPTNPSSISSNIVTKILEDHTGNLWVSTTKGLNRLNPAQDGFIKPKANDENKSHFSNIPISELYEDNHQQLWVGTGDGGLFLYRDSTDTFESFPNPKKAELRAIIDGPDDQLILGYGAWVLREKEGGVSIFDKKNCKYLPVKIEPSSKNLSVIDILQKDKFNYWVGSYNSGLKIYNTSSKKLTEPTNYPNSKSNLIFGLFKDSNDVLWIATDGNGLILFDNLSGKFNPFRKNGNQDGLSVQSITSITEDKDGVFWVGTVNDGINIINKYKSRIQNLQFTNQVKPSISGKSVLALSESNNGKMWIGFDHGGVNLFDRNNNSIRQFRHNPKHPNSISDEVINGLYESKNGQLFIGTYLNGFDIYNKQTNKFIHFGKTNPVLGALYIKCFYEDISGNIWMGSREQGLIKFNPNTQKAINFKHDPQNPNSINHNHVSALLEENENSIWIGTFNGINQINLTTEKLKSWKHSTSDSTSLSGNQVYSLCKDSHGGLWVGTDNGLNYYDRINDNFKHFTTANGLPSNTIKGILSDDNNNLWISTNRGISKFSIDNHEIKNLGYEDGIIGLEFNENSIAKANDGTLFFGSTHGVTYFHPNDINPNPIVPSVIITDFLIANKKVVPGAENSPLKKNISETELIELNHKHSVISFEFVALNYLSPQKNQYAYILEGFDQDWNYVGAQNQATYTNLNPGEYTFKVKGANNDGIWNDKGTSIKIVISPPWWRTWWAVGLYFFIFLLVSLGARKAALTKVKLLNDLKLERMAKEKEHEISQIKLKFFTNISHEFRTPLTLIIGPVEKLLDTNLNKEQIEKHLRLIHRNSIRLLQLVNQLMDFRKINQGKMKLHASEEDIVSFIEEIVDNFRFLAVEKAIELTFTSSLKSQRLWIDKEKIDKVIHNLLSNAFKVIKKGDRITVELDLLRNNSNQQNSVSITVSDTGPGISKENLKKIFEEFYQVKQRGSSTGIGLSLSKSLIELHHGELLVMSKEKEGSSFIIHLPIGKAHLENRDGILFSQEPIQPYTPLKPLINAEVESLPKNILDDKMPKTILIVEDDNDVNFFLRESLQSGFNIKTCQNGQEGLEIAAKNNIDLIISDIMMPGMDGLELCKKVKSNIDTSHIPVILLTAKTEDDEIIEGLQTGADDYILKPFSMKLLMARVENLLESRLRLKEQYKNQLDLAPGNLTNTGLDNDFLEEVIKITEENMTETEFNIEAIIRTVGMSRSKFFRKIKSLTGQSPQDFIQTIRFKNAAKLLVEGEFNVSEVAFKVGYASTKNFRNGFKKHFGKTPTEFLKSYKHN
ncbi:hybrid sensor histidine kinase/response regulator transcription factor [Flexithrix dorotheae]|uniref:hybrid sensor histidine kinase/response regulator transcription factor n=1 Tax=Flexithrix dorotheae TaxID=70993 RepID=UPI00035DD30F|nr:hybrid sensor histidine kinase/response regulator transcription factor [Flexithrix dorotheae]